MNEPLRLGLDLGTNSIGWALFTLDEQRRPRRLFDSGVRIFSDSRDPESSDPLGKARREARQPRRQRDRRLQRKKRVMNELIRQGLTTDVEAATARGQKVEEALASFRGPQGKPLHHIRTLEPMEDAVVVAISDSEGRPYKRYAKGENAEMDVPRCRARRSSWLQGLSMTTTSPAGAPDRDFGNVGPDCADRKSGGSASCASSSRR